MLVLPGHGASGPMRPPIPRLNAYSPMAQNLFLWWPVSMSFGSGVGLGRAAIGQSATLLSTGPTLGASTHGAVLEASGTGFVWNNAIVNGFNLMSSPYSFATWLYPSSASVEMWSGVLETGGANSSMCGISLLGGLWRYCWNRNNNFINPGITPTANEWALLVGTSDTTTHRFYLNGIERGSAAANHTSSTFNAVRLGAGIGGASPVQGQAHDLLVWTRTLSAGEVWSLYDPATRWDLYWVPGRRVFFDVGAAFDAALFPHLRLPDVAHRAPAMIPSGRIA